MELLFTVVTYDKDGKYTSHPMITISSNFASDILDIIKNYEQKGLKTEFVYINREQPLTDSHIREITKNPIYILC